MAFLLNINFMKIGKLTNSISCEYEMQDKMSDWINDKGIPFIDEYRVSEVSRIADFLLLKDQSQLINIEAKCNDFECMIKQLNDHAQYCDFSFAFIPDYPATPRWFKNELLGKGYGLIVYNIASKIITEVLEAHSNKPINKELRRNICAKIREATLQRGTVLNAI
jgi:hypothetical protein